MAFLEAHNITKTFFMGQQALTVLNNITIDIKAQELVAITGKSGSGKSTLMNILGCLDSPTQGTYLIDGQDVSHMSKNQQAHIRNQKVGFVFQRFHLLPDMTALQNVELPQLYAGKTEQEAAKQAQHVLQMVGLEDRVNHYPSEMSGGEQQRVAIARALVNEPAIILADEPTGNLDSVTGGKIMELFKTLNKKYNVTIIIITHDPQLAQQTDRVIKIHDGIITDNH